MDAEGRRAELSQASSDSVRWAFLAGTQLLRANRASLLLRDGDEKVMRVIASIGLDSDVVPSIRVPFGEGIAGLAAERNLVLCGEANGSRYITVPIVRAGMVVGVLNVTGREGPNDFDDEDVALARSVADHLAHLLALSLSQLDYETGLLTASSFLQAVNREIERGRRTNTSFTLTLIKLNVESEALRFLRSSKGADLMRRAGEALQAACRGYDVVSRYAETTFGVLFPGTDELREEGLEERVNQALKPLNLPGSPLSVILGQVHYPDDGATSRELLAQAVRQCEAHGPDEASAPRRSSDAGA